MSAPTTIQPGNSIFDLSHPRTPRSNAAHESDILAAGASRTADNVLTECRRLEIELENLREGMTEMLKRRAR